MSNVNHPSHYNIGKIECIDVLEDIMSPEEFEGFLHGNAMKYLWRWKYKNGLEDLEKCKYYIDKLINHQEDIKNLHKMSLHENLMHLAADPEFHEQV